MGRPESARVVLEGDLVQMTASASVVLIPLLIPRESRLKGNDVNELGQRTRHTIEPARVQPIQDRLAARFDPIPTTDSIDDQMKGEQKVNVCVASVVGDKLPAKAH